jgi:hypothetical protein
MAGEPVPGVPVHLRGRRAAAEWCGAARGGGGGAVPARVAPPAARRVARAPATTPRRATAHGTQRSCADTHSQCSLSTLLTHLTVHIYHDIHTYNSRFIPKRVADLISDIPPRYPRFAKIS